ncbi:hypothetical protein BB560_002466, partial [Smittium megazygosporum]
MAWYSLSSIYSYLTSSKNPVVKILNSLGVPLLAENWPTVAFSFFFFYIYAISVVYIISWVSSIKQHKLYIINPDTASLNQINSDGSGSPILPLNKKPDIQPYFTSKMIKQKLMIFHRLHKLEDYMVMQPFSR